MPINGHPLVRNLFLNVFYLKKWYCPSRTFFDHPTQLCSPCSLENCAVCLNSTDCLVCDTQNNYYLSGKTCSFLKVTEVSSNGCNRLKINFEIKPNTDIELIKSKLTILNSQVSITNINKGIEFVEVQLTYLRDIAS